MSNKYIKPEIEIEDIEDSVIMGSSNKHTGKPGYGWGAGGHDGPPGQKHNLEDDYEYEQELWDY